MQLNITRHAQEDAALAGYLFLAVYTVQRQTFGGKVIAEPHSHCDMPVMLYVREVFGSTQ